MQTSLVQAFDEHGEGLVLRGHDFDWTPTRPAAARRTLPPMTPPA